MILSFLIVTWYKNTQKSLTLIQSLQKSNKLNQSNQDIDIINVNIKLEDHLQKKDNVFAQQEQSVPKRI